MNSSLAANLARTSTSLLRSGLTIVGRKKSPMTKHFNPFIERQGRYAHDALVVLDYLPGSHIAKDYLARQFNCFWLWASTYIPPCLYNSLEVTGNRSLWFPLGWDYLVCTMPLHISACSQLCTPGVGDICHAMWLWLPCHRPLTACIIRSTIGCVSLAGQK